MQDRLIDLSHAVGHGMETYAGLPGPPICDYLIREQSRSHCAAGTEFQNGRIELVGNTGAYARAACLRQKETRPSPCGGAGGFVSCSIRSR